MNNRDTSSAKPKALRSTIGPSIYMPKLNVLTLVCASLLLVHTWVECNGGVIAHEGMYTKVFGLSVQGLKEGKLWQLISYSLLHGNWFHLLTNVLVIWLLGSRLLRIVGQKKLSLTILFSCVGGGLGFAFVDSFSELERNLVGASGIAFGLFVSLAVLDPFTKIWPLSISAKNMAYGMLISSFLLCLLDPNLPVPGLLHIGAWLCAMHLEDIFRVAHACHLAGGLAGAYVSRKLLGKLLTLEDLRKKRLH